MCQRLLQVYTFAWFTFYEHNCYYEIVIVATAIFGYYVIAIVFWYIHLYDHNHNMLSFNP